MFISARTVLLFFTGMLTSVLLIGAVILSLPLGPRFTGVDSGPAVQQTSQPAIAGGSAAATGARPQALGQDQPDLPSANVAVAPAAPSARAAAKTAVATAADVASSTRIYVQLTEPQQATRPDSRVPYPEKALADLHHAFLTGDRAAALTLLSVQARLQVLDLSPAVGQLFVATEGLFAIDGHTTPLPHVYHVPFRFVLPGASSAHPVEVAGTVVVRRPAAASGISIV